MLEILTYFFGDKMTSPVFIMSSERSGTNLLRRTISKSQDVYYGPSPLHLLNHLYYAEPYYGDLNCDVNFKSFVKDGLGLAYEHFAPWDELIDINEVLSRYDEFASGNRSSGGLMHVLNMIYVHRKGFKSYVCKDNNIFDYVSIILAELPAAKFIYLYRDPRDVVLSQLKRPLQIQEVVYLSKLWKNEQVSAIRAAKDLEKEGKLVAISYEDLIKDEAEEVSRICRFLNVVVQEEDKNLFSNESVEHHEWGNLNKPIMKNNTKKYLNELSKGELNKIESVCWHQMKWLCYMPLIKKPTKLSRLYTKISYYKELVKLLLRTRFDKNGITESQRKRINYTKKIANKWR